MATVSFRVSREIKKRMDRLRELNWSEILRSYVIRVLESEEARLSKKDFARIVKASRDIDALRELSGPDWSGAEVVIKWRRLRK
ncbi:MAG: hypothetical protein QXH32_09780 [Candidatus Caldarchaeum sp.]